MNFYNPRRLSPIPRSDEQESDAGAEVRDIPFYRPPRTPSKITPLEQNKKLPLPPPTRNLVALIGTQPLAMHPLDAASPVIDFGDTASQASYESDVERSSREEHRSRKQMQLREAMYEREELRAREELLADEETREREELRSQKLLRSRELLRSRDGHAEPGETMNRPELPERPASRAEPMTDHTAGWKTRRANVVNTASSPSTIRSQSVVSDDRSSYQTNGTSLPPLQHKAHDEHGQLVPLDEDDLDPGSFDLVAPVPEGLKQYSLETRSEQLFSSEHLQVIFSDPSLLLRFTAFLGASRPTSVPVLIYYLDAIKALKAISYSNAIAEALEPIPGYDFTADTALKTVNTPLKEKADQAFGVMVREDLPAFITHTYIQTVSLSIQRRVTGTLPPSLREASEGLAEVFCLTDPSRPDNPIVFASAEFHRTTQYGMSYVIGKNCRFLQGPKTNPFSVRRLREKVDAGVEHCEVFLNYRRDGSPFMNLLMTAPLCDSRGTIRYFIGAQVDVSGLVKECSDMESLHRLVVKTEKDQVRDSKDDLEYVAEQASQKDEFQELSEMLNLQELDTVRRCGGRMHKESEEESPDSNFKDGNWGKPRLLINAGSPEGGNGLNKSSRTSGRLSGIYENYLLIRPYPSLRILFASPSLRVPGILQSPFMAKIGGSNRVREELTQALADGRGVTAKVKWVSKHDLEGRNRWIHCTPLIGSNGAIGVWMVVIVDDESSVSPSKRFKMPPPVDPKFGRTSSSTYRGDDGSLRDFALTNGARHRIGSSRDSTSTQSYHGGGTDRSSSPYSLRI